MARKPYTSEQVKAMLDFITGDHLYPEVKPYIRNAVLCKRCGTVAESGSRHAMNSCECGSVSADGGLDYLRRAFREGAEFTELSEKNPAYKDPNGTDDK